MIGIDDYFGKAARARENRTPAPASLQKKEMETAQDASRPMVIDLHVHSAPASPCSSVTIEQLIEEARSIGLDGICLTDHNHRWDPSEVEALRQKHGFLILRGNEITTDQGDILVLGLEEDIQGVIRLRGSAGKGAEGAGLHDRGASVPGISDFRNRLSRPDAAKSQHAAGISGSGRRGGHEQPRFRERKPALRHRWRKSSDCPSSAAVMRTSPGKWDVMPRALLIPFTMNRDLIAALKKGRFSPVAFRGPECPRHYIITGRNRHECVKGLGEDRPQDGAVAAA